MSPPVPDFIATEARFGAQNYQPLGVILSRGEGVWLWDTQGNRYLDCLSAYSAVNQGHCHPKILAAMVEQAGKLTLTSRWSSSVLECAILKRINAGTCSKSLPDLNGFYRTGASKIPYP
jgi:acetylornithine/succinyldiaminopimelate/putrescine aminotransferase